MCTPAIMEKNKINILDVSELMRPEPTFASKPIGRYRDYDIDHEDPIKERVRITYTQMHMNQTVDYVKKKWPSGCLLINLK